MSYVRYDECRTTDFVMTTIVSRELNMICGRNFTNKNPKILILVFPALVQLEFNFRKVV